MKAEKPRTKVGFHAAGTEGFFGLYQNREINRPAARGKRTDPAANRRRFEYHQ